ncbi:PTS sugar transporter subunit IIA [Collinsella sp. AGMB00827]|uniref:Mannitol-specific phosphotransferase enzyme IIA component n=1 Tax=Collinsella ureilytica TaxID=2869515 RepID=A0ABS7MHS6_9ACTN|nr:PTS sugar transporter subunit IIA [Collinsella urealyticum]MBY4796894.1 PTS sugar transporter subunit IIA [Collinsella urealyticum]
MDDPELDALFEALTSMSLAHGLVSGEIAAPALKEKAKQAPALAISAADVQVGLASLSREDAIRVSGELLVQKGCVDAAYIDAMGARDKLTSVYLGMGVAIPHGTAEAKDSVKKTGVVIQQYPAGIDLDGEKAYLLVGIAGKGSEHLEVLAAISEVLEDEAVLEKMKTTDDVDWIVRSLTEGQ